MPKNLYIYTISYCYDGYTPHYIDVYAYSSKQALYFANVYKYHPHIERVRCVEPDNEMPVGTVVGTDY